MSYDMSYNNTDPAGYGASQSNSNRQSFGSRITTFADIADISIQHIPDDQPSDRSQRRFTAPPQTYSYTPPAVAPTVTTPHAHNVRRDTYNGANTSFAPVQPQHGLNSSPHLRMAESAVSLQSEFDAQGRRLHGRESLVSMQSYYDPPPTQQRHDAYSDNQTTYSRPTSWIGGSQPSYEPITSPTQGYEPVRSPDTISRSWSRSGRTRGSFLPTFSFGHGPIAEEEHDMTELLPSASSIGRSPAPAYDAVPTHDDAELTFDPTSTLGPSTLKNDLFVKKLQEEESKGHLTGGLGSGWKTETRLLGSELLRGPSQMQRSLTRRLTSRSPRHQSDVIKEIGQQEADRRGEIVEVVLDEPAGVDLSNAVGPAGLNSGTGNNSTNGTPPERQKKTQVFYPQPNWKPFSMRWPYLSALIFLSLGLAVMQEFIYQQSRRKPLIKFKSPDEVPAHSYFAMKFLPTIISVTYGVLWQVTELEVKRLEAYYQLSKPGGALATESINVDYITSRNITRPFRALMRGHYAVSICSLGTNLAVSLVPTFSAACIVLTPDRDHRMADPGLEKAVIISAAFSRLLTATLAICAVCALILFFLLQTRRSGLLSDVKGIAGLASMAVVCHILMDFKDMDTATHEAIHQRLRYNRYVLQNSALAPDSENTSSSKRAADESRYQHTDVSEGSHPLMMRAAGYGSFVAGVVAFIGLMIAVLFTKASVVTDKVPWLVTALAVGIKLGWSVLDTDMRMMEPFYILSRRHAPARVLTLDYTAMPFAYMPWQAYANGDKIMFLVGVGSVIAEVLTVLATSLAAVDGRDFLIVVKNNGGGVKDSEGAINAGQETVTSFWFSLALAGAILLYLAVVASLVYARRRHRFLPRQPNTIASVLAYIHQSKMLYDFVGMSKMSSADIAVKLGKAGKTYGLGWFEGRDGQSHCGVDEEELTGFYKHGMVPGEINKPWASRWDTLE